MTKKINSKINLIFPIFIILFAILVYTRFINIGWGLPFPMHPDERNMANALQSLRCEFLNLKECFNPNFFAYGQFPLYLGYFLIWISHGFRNFGKFVITFDEAVMSLRIISVIASVINAFVLVKIVKFISRLRQNFGEQVISLLIIIFPPFFIQFSHFGTTESLLMLFYSLIVFYSLRVSDSGPRWNNFFSLSIFSGMAVATKISSILFLATPAFAFISNIKYQKTKLHIKIINFLITIFCFVFFAFVFAIIFSPHNIIHWKDFLSSINYEGDVALGRYVVFYTRQFVGSVPILFQFVKVFPYVLGLPVLILSLFGFLFLSWKDKGINILRFAFLIYFLPTAFIFAKWSRFMSPILPLMLVFAVLFFLKIKFINFIKTIIVILMIIPGVAYLSVYQKSDTRFQASKWIYENIPNNSTILSETANVVDIPISDGTMKQSSIYNVISFDFYKLDESPLLQTELQSNLAAADYIFVPSRRIFANHPKQRYPILNKYYEDLFSGKLGFKKVAEFSTGLNDEMAEETWTVFDHPTIRIYKRITNDK